MLSKKRVAVWRMRPRFLPTVATRLIPLVVAVAFFFFGVHYLPRFPRIIKLLSSIFGLLPDIAGYVIAVVGVALLFMQEDLKKLEAHRTIRVAIAFLVFALGLGAVIADSAQKTADRNRAQTEQDALTAQIGKLLDQQQILVAQVTTLSTQSVPQLFADIKSPSRASAPVKKPDLHLELVYPEEFAVEITNAKNAGVAYKPKYSVVLADLDNLEGDLLKIPTQEGDFIRPGEGWGPNMAMGLPNVKSVVKNGDRVTGYAMVLCPDCIKTRAYWIYYTEGQGGWYCEMPRALFPYKMQFFKDMKAHLHSYLEQLAPPSCRTEIGNLK